MLHFIERVFRVVQTRVRQDEGQTLIEYALLLGLVSLALIGALNVLAVDLSGFFERFGDALDSAGPS